MRRQSFAAPRNDVSIHETCMNVRVCGYFDTKFQIRFNEMEIDEAVRQLVGGIETTCVTSDGPKCTAATK